MIKNIFKKSPLIHAILTIIIECIAFGVSLFFSNVSLALKIGLFIFFLVAVFISTAFSHSNIIMEQKQNDLSTEILYGEYKIMQYRYNSIYELFKNAIYNNATYQKLNYDPKDKIYSILLDIVTCFKNFLGHETENISATVFFHFDFQEEGDWTRLGQNYFEAYESNELVMKDKNSFGKYVMGGTQIFYFLNDKYEEGFKRGIYKLNDKDKETEKIYHTYGSIIGIKIGITVNEREHIRALLTISTYGKQIDNVPHGIFREKIEKELKGNILPIFKTNIESELMQLYLQIADNQQ